MIQGVKACAGKYTDIAKIKKFSPIFCFMHLKKLIKPKHLYTFVYPH